MNRSSMLRIVDYNHPSDEKTYSPRGHFIAHANIFKIITDEDKTDISSDEVESAPVPVSAVPVHTVDSTTFSSASIPMEPTIRGDMYRCFVGPCYFMLMIRQCLTVMVRDYRSRPVL